MRNATCRSLLGGGSGWPPNCEFKAVFANACNPSVSDETDGDEDFLWGPADANYDAIRFFQGNTALPQPEKPARTIRLQWQGDSGDAILELPVDKGWATWYKNNRGWADLGSSGNYDMWNPRSPESLSAGWFTIVINGVIYPCWATDGAVGVGIHSTLDYAYIVATLYGYVDATGESFAQMSLANPGAWLDKGFEIRYRCDLT